MKADLPNQFPLDEQGKDKSNERRAMRSRRPSAGENTSSGGSRNGCERAAAETVRWAVLEPKKATCNVPRLSIEPGRLGVRQRRPEQARCLYRAAQLEA